MMGMAWGGVHTLANPEKFLGVNYGAGLGEMLQSPAVSCTVLSDIARPRGRRKPSPSLLFNRELGNRRSY